jgi:hypothetical protein
LLLFTFRWIPKLDNLPCPTSTSLLDWESFTEDQINALEAEVLIMSDLVMYNDRIQPTQLVLEREWNACISFH